MYLILLKRPNFPEQAYAAMEDANPERKTILKALATDMNCEVIARRIPTHGNVEEEFYKPTKDDQHPKLQDLEPHNYDY